MKKVLIFLLILVCLGGIYFFIRPAGYSLPWSADKQKEYANLLTTQGLHNQAIKEYERLLYSSNLSNDERANLAYLIGNIYLDELKDYESALASYLKVKVFAPNSKIIDEVNQKSIECLERLGRYFDAQKELDKTTLLKPGKEIPKGQAVAKIGKRIITIEELENQISNLPSQWQTMYKDKSKQLDFLKNYIATELMYDSAKRRNLDKDKDINNQIEQLRKGLIVQKLLQEETKGKIQVTDSDIKVYYNDHKSEFVDDKKKQKSLDDVKDEIKNRLSSERAEILQRDLLQKMMQTEQVDIYESLFKK